MSDDTTARAGTGGPVIERISSRTVYENPWIGVREDRVRRPDGSEGVYGYLDKADFALVVPVEDGGFHLVEEYRYPVGRRSWAFPQGGWPRGETGTAQQLARRELAEEAGLRAAALRPLGFLHSAHGVSTQGFHAFLATQLRAGTPAREHEEQDMRQCWVERSGFLRMIREGAITDDSTVAAYTLLTLHEAAW